MKLVSVLDALERNPERRFNQVEIAFFWRWWREATQKDQERMRAVIRNGQFNFLLGRIFKSDLSVISSNQIREIENPT